MRAHLFASATMAFCSPRRSINAFIHQLSLPSFKIVLPPILAEGDKLPAAVSYENNFWFELPCLGKKD